MPRRPRLSIPTIFLNAPEGFAMWNADGRIVDRNPAIDRMFALDTGEPADSGLAESELAFAEAMNAAEIGIVPPKRAFEGQSASLTVNHPNDAARLIKLDFWPCRNDQGQVIGVLGRLESVGESEIASSFDPAKLWGIRLQEELARRRARQKPLGLDTIIGQGPGHAATLERVQAAVRADCPVVIVGETATGRHHIARVLHLSHQKTGSTRAPLIPLDAASLPSEILASDFLGIEPAGVPGEENSSTPEWRVPNGSTILIESLAALDSRLQDGIARARGEVRIISLACSRDEIERLAPWFRARVATIVIELEPLRRRIDEIPILAQSLANRFQTGSKYRVEGFTAEAIELLKMYDWPGNFRELERVIRKICETAKGPFVESTDIPAGIQGAHGGAWTKPSGAASPENRLHSAVQDASRAAVEDALQRFGSNKAAVARALGVSRPKLYRLLAELGLDSSP